MSESLKKGVVAVPAAAIVASALLLMSPMLASAASPHFVGNPSCDVVGGDLECSGKVAGLGNVEEVTAFIQADVTCTNRGGNEAIGLSGGEEQTFSVENGQITFTDLTLENPCRDGMSATFADVALVIDGTTLPIPGTFSA
jgi:hypothetical protein